MIAFEKLGISDRESLIDYLRRSAGEVSEMVGLRSEAEMQELADRNGVCYIPRKPIADDLDDEEEWTDDETLDEEAASPVGGVPPAGNDRECAPAESEPTPVRHSKSKVDTDSATETLPADPIAELRELVALAKHGDDQAVSKISKILDAHPAIWQTVGDLSAHAEELLISLIADGNALVSESMQREIKRLKAELAEGQTPSPLERLTIQRIVACWLMCQHTDRATLAADAAGTKAAHWGKRQEIAEKRFQQAIKSLDLVRRLKPRKTASTKPIANAEAEASEETSQSKPSTKATASGSPAKAAERRQQKSESSGDDAPKTVNRIRRLARDADLVS